MIREINTGSDESTLDAQETYGLGGLKFHHPSGTFSLTPASRILFKAIIDNKELLKGIGIDWGTGIGCQAILAARITAVQAVYGLEISKSNLDAAAVNAEENGVNDKVRFILSDSYCPFDDQEKQLVEGLRGKVDFIVSNPPSSDWDDGFGFRRMVMDGAKAYLKENGVVLLNVSLQYGADRIESLCHDGIRYMGVAATTKCMPFDLKRPDLLDCLRIYAREEIKGGMRYTFIKDESDDTAHIDACTALDNYRETGVSPLTKWQTHLFRYRG
jgi:hypothetical protein